MTRVATRAFAGLARTLVLLSLPLLDVAAQGSETTMPWYGRLGYSLARVDGGAWSTRGLEGFELAIGRELGRSRTVRGAFELQGESLNQQPDDLTCAPLPGAERCAPRAPSLFLVTAAGGLVVQRSIWRVGGFVGPTYISASDAGKHGGVSMRLQLAALLHPNFALAAGVGTTRLSSLQSTTLWIPRAGVSLRLSLPR